MRRLGLVARSLTRLPRCCIPPLAPYPSLCAACPPCAAPRIQSLLRRIDAKGCTLAADPVVCEDIFGGAPSIAAYDTSRRLVVLNPSVPSAYMNQKEWTRAITHELIHAYDHCRVVLDPTSCKQNACTEIRAANLSGDCDFGVEFSRLGIPIPFGGHQQKCVKRRALASINMHPSCVGSDTKKVVDDVWDVCYADTAPFPTN